MLSAKQRELCKRLESERDRLFRVAYSWSHNPEMADEVVQETMIKAIQNIDKVKNIDALDSWLFRVLSNSFFDLYRKRRVEIDIDEIVLLDRDTPESIHIQNEMLTSVRSAINNLPLKHRQVLTLIDIESFTYAEVANILDIPQGTVMSRLNRARLSLKKILIELRTEDDNKVLLKVVK